MNCQCGFELESGLRCSMCGDKNEIPGKLSLFRVPPRSVALTDGNSSSDSALTAIEAPPNLGLAQETFLAVMNKVVAALASTSNTLEVNGYILARDEIDNRFHRQAIINVTLNGRKLAIVVPLFESETDAKVVERVRDAVRDHVAKEILRLLDLQIQPGRFAKTT